MKDFFFFLSKGIGRFSNMSCLSSICFLLIRQPCCFCVGLVISNFWQHTLRPYGSHGAKRTDDDDD